MRDHSARRRTLPGAIGVGLVLATAVAAGALQAKQRKGRAPDDAPDVAARHPAGRLAVVGRSVTIGKPRQELFDFWKSFENFPQFMENVEKIERTGDDGRAVWTIKAPAGQTVAVETEVVDEENGKSIAWRSTDRSDIETEGRVTFEDAPGDRGTRVALVIGYKPPAGAIGRGIAKIFRRDPKTQARHDLKRLKMLMETGEIATSARRRDQTRAAQQENG